MIQFFNDGREKKKISPLSKYTGYVNGSNK